MWNKDKWEVKRILINEVVSQIKDSGAKRVLLELISRNENKIDWDMVYQDLVYEMPELRIMEKYA